MPRDSQIPLFLWIATAILVHLMWGGGAEHAANRIEETLDIGRFARAVRQHVRLSTQTLEISTVDEPSQPDAAADEPGRTPDEKQPEQEPEQESETPDPAEELSKPEPPKPVPAPEPKKLQEELEKQKQKEEEEKKKEEEEKQKEAEEEKLIELPKHKPRVAVRQHVEDKNQQDNPDAEFLGEHANRVKEQTQARITSTDQNDPRPTPGGHHAGPDEAPGNSSETRVAQMEDREGDPDRPPSENALEGREAAPPAVAEPPPRAGAAAMQPRPTQAVPPQPGQKAQAAVEAQEAMPATLALPSGDFSIPEQREARAAQKAQKARPRRSGRPQRQNDPTGLLGLGAQGVTENGINLNLSPSTAIAAIGQQQLRQERARDGERRRSEHRGSWKETSFERNRAAIENYVAGVKPGNQTALNTAHAPFANYLNAIHQRLHPMFAGRFLSSLDRMPNDHPLNNREMIANLEIVLSPSDGRIVRMGITKASGVTAFDIGALESVRKASPFGAAPESIVSPDGNVYLHWGFHRNPIYACSTYNARPFMLKARPKSAPPKVPAPAKPYEGEEQPPGRQGRAPIDREDASAVRTAKR